MSECTIAIKPHASYETRLRAVQAALTGMSCTEVAQAYGIDRTTLCRWMIRFRKAGTQGLSRKPGSGRPPRNGNNSCDSCSSCVSMTSPEQDEENSLMLPCSGEQARS